MREEKDRIRSESRRNIAFSIKVCLRNTRAWKFMITRKFVYAYFNTHAMPDSLSLFLFGSKSKVRTVPYCNSLLVCIRSSVFCLTIDITQRRRATQYRKISMHNNEALNIARRRNFNGNYRGKSF